MGLGWRFLQGFELLRRSELTHRISRQCRYPDFRVKKARYQENGEELGEKNRVLKGRMRLIYNLHLIMGFTTLFLVADPMKKSTSAF